MNKRCIIVHGLDHMIVYCYKFIYVMMLTDIIIHLL